MSTQTDDGLTYSKYRDTIKTMADEIAQEIEDDPAHEEEIPDMVWESVDSSRYIIYNGYATDVIKYADNEPQDWKHLVPDDADYRKVLQIMAYSAMEMDLYDELRDRGIY